MPPARPPPALAPATISRAGSMPARRRARRPRRDPRSCPRPGRDPGTPAPTGSQPSPPPRRAARPEAGSAPSPGTGRQGRCLRRAGSRCRDPRLLWSVRRSTDTSMSALVAGDGVVDRSSPASTSISSSTTTASRSTLRNAGIISRVIDDTARSVVGASAFSSLGRRVDAGRDRSWISLVLCRYGWRRSWDDLQVSVRVWLSKCSTCSESRSRSTRPCSRTGLPGDHVPSRTRLSRRCRSALRRAA